MNKIELRKIEDLKEHPRNSEFFGVPRQDPKYQEIKESIARNGLQEPLIILDDGTILSGHIRLSAFIDLLEEKAQESEDIDESTRRLLRKRMVPVRVHEDFEAPTDELRYLLKSNTERRHLSPAQLSTLFGIAQKIDDEAGPRKRGRPVKGEKPPREKKPRMVQTLADSVGKDVRTLQRNYDLHNNPLVSKDILARLDAKTLTKKAIHDALKEAYDTAEREQRDPLARDVDIYVDIHPDTEPAPKVSLADVVRRSGEPKPEVPEAAKPEPVQVKKPEPTPEPTTQVRVKEESFVSVGDRIALACKHFEKLLGEADLSAQVKTELVGFHSRLSGFLEAVGVLAQPKAPEPVASLQGLPTRVEDQITMFTSLVEDVGEVQDPSGVRDLLLSLSMAAKTSANRLTQAPKTFEPNGLFCPECLSPQVKTPSGEVCENGHGGVYGITKAKMLSAKAEREAPPAPKKPEPKAVVSEPKPDTDPDDFSTLLSGADFTPDEAAPSPSVKPAPLPKEKPAEPKIPEVNHRVNAGDIPDDLDLSSL